MKTTTNKVSLTKRKTPVSKKKGNGVVKKLKTSKSPKKKKAVAKKKNIKKKTTAKRTTVKKQLDDNITVILDQVLVVNNADKILVQLTALLENKQDIIIDASEVEMIDTAVFQLLVSFVIKLRLLNINHSWLNPSTEILNRGHTLGLNEEIGLNNA